MSRRERNYLEEMNAAIDAATAGVAYIPPVVGQELTKRLLAEDPDLLRGWLYLLAPEFIRMTINKRDHLRRSRSRTASQERFGRALTDHEAGDSSELLRYAGGHYLGMRFAVETGERLPLGALGAADLKFIANTYHNRAERNSLREEVIRQVAARVGDRTVGEVYTEEELRTIFESLGW